MDTDDSDVTYADSYLAAEFDSQLRTASPWQNKGNGKKGKGGKGGKK